MTAQFARGSVKSVIFFIRRRMASASAVSAADYTVTARAGL